MEKIPEQQTDTFAKILLKSPVTGLFAVLCAALVFMYVTDTSNDPDMNSDPDAGPADCPAVGDKCADGTIYAGTWKPVTDDGSALGDFYLFAAPQDLTDDQGNRLLLTFNDAVAHVAGLTYWHGHNGGRFENDAALHAAIGDERYSGEWFIPPQDVLLGNLYPNRNAGELRGTFVTVSASDIARWYWSCTELRDVPSDVWVVSFSDGGVGWNSKDVNALSSRLVRAEPRP